MFLISGYSTIIKTDLPVHDVVVKIKEQTTPKSTKIFSKRTPHPFLGNIRGNTFQLTRQIHYRNSFSPEIKCTVKSTVAGFTEVCIDMQLLILVKIFILFWLGCISLVFFIVLFSLVMANPFDERSMLVLLGPISMFAFGFALSYFGFHYERKKIVILLEKIVEGTVEGKTISNN